MLGGLAQPLNAIAAPTMPHQLRIVDVPAPKRKELPTMLPTASRNEHAVNSAQSCFLPLIHLWQTLEQFLAASALAGTMRATGRANRGYWPE